MRVEPYRLVYGNRTFLAGRTEGGMRMCPSGTHDRGRVLPRAGWRPALGVPSGLSGRGDPGDAALRGLPGGRYRRVVFQPDQTLARDDDGSKTVRFTAGGVDEMCWHLVSAVTVERPVCAGACSRCAPPRRPYGASP